jgi:large subunit ribosomal protein L15
MRTHSAIAWISSSGNLLSGGIAKAITVEGLGVTKGARTAIEAAGGSIVAAGE